MERMPRDQFIRVAVLWLATFGVFASADATEKLPVAERTKIETLLARMDDLKGAKFIRNGSEYDASTAVKFLKGKWEADSGIDSARAFVERVATKSSTTGREYKIKMPSGEVVTSSPFLLGELKKLEGRP